MEAAVPILNKVLEDENCEKTNTRKESSLSNRTLKDGLKNQFDQNNKLLLYFC